MVSKFAPGDCVIWENDIYVVKTVSFTDSGMLHDPFIYGLVPLNKPNNFKQLLVREGLLNKYVSKESEKIAKVLYGK